MSGRTISAKRIEMLAKDSQDADTAFTVMSNYNNSSRTFNDDRWPNAAGAARITRKGTVNLEPLISGASICRNCAAIIWRCINNVRLENHGTTELVAIVDSSTDAS